MRTGSSLLISYPLVDGQERNWWSALFLLSTSSLHPLAPSGHLIEKQQQKGREARWSKVSVIKSSFWIFLLISLVLSSFHSLPQHFCVRCTTCCTSSYFMAWKWALNGEGENWGGGGRSKENDYCCWIWWWRRRWHISLPLYRFSFTLLFKHSSFAPFTITSSSSCCCSYHHSRTIRIGNGEHGKRLR